MTPDQIRQIAEEYTKWFINRVTSDLETEEMPNCLKYDVANAVVADTEDVLKWLAERYCVVERSKVVEEYNCYKNSWNDVESTETILESFKEIFGSEIFNKKEI